MASRFWVGGTGTWDAATTTHWSASSGGAGGASVPGSSDDVTFDGSSGGGTVTVNFGGTITILTLSLGAFTGTFDNSVHNNNITVTASGIALSLSGTATRTINLGSATYTLTSTGNVTFSFNLVVGLTLSAASATVSFTGSGTGIKDFLPNGGGSQQFAAVSFASSSGAGYCLIGNTCVIGTLSVTAPNVIQFPAAGSMTISNALTWTGTPTSPIAVFSSAFDTVATLAVAGGSALQWCAIRDMTFTGSPTATNSFDLGNNSGITISPPAGAGTGQFFSASFF